MTRAGQTTRSRMRPVEVTLPEKRHARRFVLRAGLAMFTGAFAAALVSFLAARPTVEARFPARRAHPRELHDLAAAEYGPRVVASSYEAAAQHHPAFLVDRRPRPTLLEKWASAPADRRPWIEIRWGEPRELEELVIVQGAAYESARYLARRILLRCLGDDGALAAQQIDDAAPITRAALPCQGATGVRLEFPLDPGLDLLRIYEIEAWGR